MSGPAPLAQRTPRRDYARTYMRRYRAGRRLRAFRMPPRPPFVDRAGHCERCGHLWPAGGRCPMCAIAAIPNVSPARLLGAWALLMEVLA